MKRGIPAEVTRPENRRMRAVKDERLKESIWW